MIDLIPLQTAYIRQSKDVRDNAWVVYDTDDRELAELPNHLSPEQAMSYLHFARKFELEALNAGIHHGKQIAEMSSRDQVRALQGQVAYLEQQNISLSIHLERTIIEGA